VKMFCIWITMRCYFALLLSNDMFVFFSQYSLRYFSLKLVSSIKLLFWYKVHDIRFRLEGPLYFDRSHENLLKIDFKLFSLFFRHPCISLC